MILTQCAVCATDLGLTRGKKCGRCSTRYCGAECQKQHWEQGGHDTLCKKIKKAGGAEQYHADTKYTEAVSVAVEKCAEDTKGQTCFICTQALHWKTKEGLVRGCACRGTAGFAHVSSLVEQAKLLFEEAKANNWHDKRGQASWRRWHKCSLCEQGYHSVVSCALGWACWKTYLKYSDNEVLQQLAMSRLGCGLSDADRHADAASIREAELSMLWRLEGSESSILTVQSNLANSYQMLGRLGEALRLRRDVYSGRLKLNGDQHADTLLAVTNYASCLLSLRRFGEVKSLLRKAIPVAPRVLGESDSVTLKMRGCYAEALKSDPGATLDDVREAVTTFEELERTARRVFGGAHPITKGLEKCLRDAQAALRAREGVESIREGVEAMSPGGA